jgi:HEAT repeat protein
VAVGRLAKDGDPEIRVRAAQAMARLKDPRSLIDLVMLLQDRDRKVRLEAIRAMSFYKDKRVVRPLIDHGLTDLDDQVSQEAAGVIILVGPSAIPELLKTYDGAEIYIQKRSLFILGELAAKADPPEKKAVNTLLHRVLKSDASTWELRRAACVGLVSVGDAASVAILEELIVRYQDTTDAAAFIHAARNTQEQIRSHP